MLVLYPFYSSTPHPPSTHTVVCHTQTIDGKKDRSLCYKIDVFYFSIDKTIFVYLKKILLKIYIF
jgi:hypothetical protein